ncbi:hypothetical protein J6590_053448 [Homalodisca vitripennis]|nr:hypothetical protein J6590_053448 [Homalodisca vitripennis]
MVLEHISMNSAVSWWAQTSRDLGSILACNTPVTSRPDCGAATWAGQQCPQVRNVPKYFRAEASEPNDLVCNRKRVVGWSNPVLKDNVVTYYYILIVGFSAKRYSHGSSPKFQ